MLAHGRRHFVDGIGVAFFMLRGHPEDRRTDDGRSRAADGPANEQTMPIETSHDAFRGSRVRAFLTACIAGWLAACGGRSSLDGAEGSGGGSGAGSSGGGRSSPPGGSSGSGGGSSSGSRPSPNPGGSSGGGSGSSSGVSSSGVSNPGGSSGAASSSGSGSSGGISGSSGSSSGVLCAGLAANEELVDNMNDGSRFIPNVNGRSGDWSAFHDTASPNAMMWPPDGTFAMSDSGDPCRKLTARSYGGGFTQFSGFEVGLGGPYDASKYKGISFWAKMGASSSPYLRVSFPDKNTDPEGGICSPTPGAANQCYDYFAKQITLTSTWTKYAARFTELVQIGFGNRAPQVDASTLFRIEWDIPAGATFDDWVDDLSLLTQ
jgi:hypothetical protein